MGLDVNENLCDPPGVDDYKRLGDQVKEARKRKYRTVEKARAEARLSRGAWDNVEHGRPAKELTYNSIEFALGWPLGECARILAGDSLASDDPFEATILNSNMDESSKLRALELHRQEVERLRAKGGDGDGEAAPIAN